MDVVLGSDQDGFETKEAVKKYLQDHQYREENTAHMTAEHNGAKAIAIGTGVLGLDKILTIVQRYLDTEYADGRHQIRLDMLEKMI